MPPPLRRGFAKLRNIGDRDNTSRVSSDVGGARYDSLFGQSFLFVVATLLVDPSFSLVVPSHDNFHRVKEGLSEENEKERERDSLGPVRRKNNAPQPLEYKPGDRCTIRRCPLERRNDGTNRIVTHKRTRGEQVTQFHTDSLVADRNHGWNAALIV